MTFSVARMTASALCFRKARLALRKSWRNTGSRKTRQQFSVSRCGPADSSSGTPAGTKKLADDAKGLQSKLGPVVAAKTELDQVSKTTTKDDYRYRQAIWEGPHNKYETALKEYNDFRKNLENAHPMVMVYNLDPLNPATQGHLAKLGIRFGHRAEHVGEELAIRLKNIDKVQKKAIDDRSYVWSLERIVGVAANCPISRITTFSSIRDFKARSSARRLPTSRAPRS